MAETNMNETMRRNVLTFAEAITSVTIDPPSYDLMVQMINDFTETLRRGGNEEYNTIRTDGLLSKGRKGMLVELSPCSHPNLRFHHFATGVYLFENEYGITVRYTGTKDKYHINLVHTVAYQPFWEHTEWPSQCMDDDFDHHWDAADISQGGLIQGKEWCATVPKRCVQFLMECVENMEDYHSSPLYAIPWDCLKTGTRKANSDTCRFPNNMGVSISRSTRAKDCDALVRIVYWTPDSEEYTTPDTSDPLPLEKIFPGDCIKVDDSNNLYRMSPSRFMTSKLFQHVSGLAPQ